MRAAIVRLAEQRTPGERRQVLGAAIRQLERADIYVAAVACMEIDDRAASHALSQLRSDLEGLKRYLSERRARIRT